MENEIMNTEVIEVIEDVAEVKTGMGTCGAMLIGGGLTLAVIAGVKVVKKFIAERKAKKAAEAEASDYETEE